MVKRKSTSPCDYKKKTGTCGIATSSFDHTDVILTNNSLSQKSGLFFAVCDLDGVRLVFF